MILSIKDFNIKDICKFFAIIFIFQIFQSIPIPYVGIFWGIPILSMILVFTAAYFSGATLTTRFISAFFVFLMPYIIKIPINSNFFLRLAFEFLFIFIIIFIIEYIKNRNKQEAIKVGIKSIFWMFIGRILIFVGVFAIIPFIALLS